MEEMNGALITGIYSPGHETAEVFTFRASSEIALHAYESRYSRHARVRAAAMSLRAASPRAIFDARKA